MSRTLTNEECLALDIDIYNKAMDLTWEKDKVEKNLSGELSICKYCGRKYSFCCICEEATNIWNNMIESVQQICDERNLERNKKPVGNLSDLLQFWDNAEVDLKRDMYHYEDVRLRHCSLHYNHCCAEYYIEYRGVTFNLSEIYLK